MYQAAVDGPCQYVGYSFPGPWEEQLEQKRDGAEIAGMNRMWIPVSDPDAPYGVGYRLPERTARSVRQRFHQRAPFRGVLLMIPTDFSKGSIRLRVRGKTKDRWCVLADKEFRDIPDEYVVRAAFAEQAPGLYEIQVDYLHGSVGVWTAPAAGDAPGPVYVDGKWLGSVSYSIGAFDREPICGITPAAAMAAGKSSRPKPLREWVLKWAMRTS
jgi:hypothetical protein